MRNEPLRRAFRLDLCRSLSEGQCFSLCQNICEQHVVLPSEWIERLRKGDEVARNEPRPLVNQLVERVLAVSSRFSPIHWTCVAFNFFPVEPDVLAVAFHRQLLEVGRKTFQVLFVGQDGDRLRAEEIVVPDGQKSISTGRFCSNGTVRKCSSI